MMELVGALGWMRRAVGRLCLVAVGGLGGLTAGAEVQVARVFGSNMVLQRDCRIPVWGRAKPGETITVRFKGQARSTVAAADGAWRVTLDPLPASGVPSALRVLAGRDEREFENVLIGDVWIASGQSNMGCSFGELKLTPELDAANPQIRLVGGFGTISPAPAGNRFPTGRWKECTPHALRSFSCVAYYFARKVQPELGVPVGMVDMSMGCSSIEAWLPPEVFEAHVDWRSELGGIDRMRNVFRERKRYSEAQKADFMRAHAGTAYGRVMSGCWMKDGVPVQEKFDFALWHASVVRPSVLYVHAVRSLAPFAIRGVLWYQGETNVNDSAYAEKQRALIRAWRGLWGQGELPFYTVQIAPFRHYGRLTDCWLQQYETARTVKNTGIVSTVDISDLDECHPPNKRDVGLRLAALALRETYGKARVVASGPVYRSSEVRGDRIVVTFAQADAGLRTRDGKAPDWFEIAGEDATFVKAQARIVSGDKVEVRAPAVPAPRFVRCAWHYTAEPNLANGAGWPVWPFNTALPFFREPRSSYATP